MKRQRRAPVPGGFSLVELLTVVSIIALLIGLLVPSLARAKDISQRSVCMANLRRLAQAALQYTTWNNEALPPFRLTKVNGVEYVNAYGRKQPRWHWFLDQGAGPVITRSKYATDAAYQAATTMDNDYFLCPSADDVYARDERHGAYGYNFGYLGNAREKTGGGYENFPVPISSFPATSGTIIFADSRGGITDSSMTTHLHGYTLDPPKLPKTSTGFGPSKLTEVPEQWKHSPAVGRHLDEAVVSFLDGHAETRAVTELGYQVDEDGIVIKDQGDNRLFTGTGKDGP